MSGVLHGVLASLKAAAAAATDSFFKYVTLLLHGDGTNGAQNNTFLDGSTNNFTITRNGNTTQGSFSPFSQTGWSNYFDGTGDFLTLASNAAFAYGTGDFTWEAWIYPTSTNTGYILDHGSNGGVIQFNAGRLVYYNPTVGIGSVLYTVGFANNPPLNTWHHIAAVRSGGTTFLYFNGVLSTSATDGHNYGNQGVSIGQFGGGGFNYLGYISNLRLVKGTAVYTANFTPPTAPLTAITNTSLLTCQSNRFIDNSTNAFAITRNGDVSIQAFSPFTPAAYSSSTNGGSGYFDGTGDYLTAASNAAFDIEGGAYTIEGWFYFNSLPAGTRFFVFEGTTQTRGLIVSTTTTNLEINHFGTGAVLTATNAAVGIVSSWAHVCVVSNGTNRSIFVNGTRFATATSALFQNTNNAVGIAGIGGTYAGSNPNAYISNFRVVKGSAVYDPTLTTLTVPTSPLTAITNTSLLCNFTNGGIFDNASQTVLETVGNAQVSTTQKKFGTGSMYFDGTGDWLTAIDRPPLRFGTGPFTIECWLYLGATGAARGIIAKGTSTTGWLLSTDASNKVVFTYGTSTITSTGALSGSTWYHIAVVREGTGANQTKIYIDGTNDGTGTVSTDFNQTSVMYIGANRTGGDALNGYIDDLRITNGYARYTANFTAPTAAFPDN